MKDFGALSYKWNVLCNAPLPKSQEFVQDETKRLLEPEVMNKKETVTSQHDNTAIHMNSQSMAACTKPV